MPPIFLKLRNLEQTLTRNFFSLDNRKNVINPKQTLLDWHRTGAPENDGNLQAAKSAINFKPGLFILDEPLNFSDEEKSGFQDSNDATCYLLYESKIREKFQLKKIPLDDIFHNRRRFGNAATA